jgi:hypothetical protein
MPALFPLVVQGINKFFPQFHRYILIPAIHWIILMLGLSCYLTISLIDHGSKFLSLTICSPMAWGWTIDLICLTAITFTINDYNIMSPNVSIARALNNRKIKINVFFAITAFFACIIQLVFWLPTVYQWSRNNCLLDGFIDNSNSASQYVVLTISMAYFRILCQMAEDGIDAIRFWVISIISFYNITFGAVLYWLL